MRSISFALFCLSLISVSGISAQKEGDFSAIENQLNYYQEVIGSSDNVDERIAASDSCKMLLNDNWNEPGFFDYPFERIQGMQVLTSPDERFRIFNWNIPLEDALHSYEAFLLIKDDSTDGELSWVQLEKSNRPPSNLKNRTLRADEWYGALYYNIIEMDRGRKDYYVLLGWDGKDGITNRKFIEVLSFDSRNEPRFGASVFHLENGVQKRVIFEYANEVSMSLKFYPRKERIIFDHLAPRSGGMEGNYAFYGPDLTFDALQLDKGKWTLESNVDVRQGPDSRPYLDPRPERRR
ncbi:hypothetical protein [Halocola ammonii]